MLGLESCRKPISLLHMSHLFLPHKRHFFAIERVSTNALSTNWPASENWPWPDVLHQHDVVMLRWPRLSLTIMWKVISVIDFIHWMKCSIQNYICEARMPMTTYHTRMYSRWLHILDPGTVLPRKWMEHSERYMGCWQFIPESLL